MTEPYINRGGRPRGIRQVTVPLDAVRAGLRDDVKTCRTLSDIAWDSKAKEDDLRRAIGPHSTPGDPWYEKSFTLPAKKEGDE